MVCSYVADSRHTGQSEPNCIRSGPNTSSNTRKYGRKSSGSHVPQAASVNMPETLTTTFGSAASSRICDAHGSSSPRAMDGFERWSITNDVPGHARTASTAAGSCGGSVSRS